MNKIREKEGEEIEIQLHVECAVISKIPSVFGPSHSKVIEQSKACTVYQ